jgi:hypothetical protein
MTEGVPPLWQSSKYYDEQRGTSPNSLRRGIDTVPLCRLWKHILVASNVGHIVVRFGRTKELRSSIRHRRKARQICPRKVQATVGSEGRATWQKLLVNRWLDRRYRYKSRQPRRAGPRFCTLAVVAANVVALTSWPRSMPMQVDINGGDAFRWPITPSRWPGAITVDPISCRADDVVNAPRHMTFSCVWHQRLGFLTSNAPQCVLNESNLARLLYLPGQFSSLHSDPDFASSTRLRQAGSRSRGRSLGCRTQQKGS